MREEPLFDFFFCFFLFRLKSRRVQTTQAPSLSRKSKPPKFESMSSGNKCLESAHTNLPYLLPLSVDGIVMRGAARAGEGWGRGAGKEKKKEEKRKGKESAEERERPQTAPAVT